MSAPRIALRSSRILARNFRQFTTSTARFNGNDTNHRANDTAEQHRKIQMEKPLNPHLTNTNSARTTLLLSSSPASTRTSPPRTRCPRTRSA
jgi:hypothetical protein